MRKAFYILMISTICFARIPHLHAQVNAPVDNVTVTGVLPETGSGHTFRTLLVVAEGYGSGLGRLPNACAQMNDIKTRLQKLGHNDLVMLSDESHDPRFKPLGANIRQAIQDLSDHAEAGDTLLVIIATHGISVDGKSYICPLDHKSPRISKRAFLESCISTDFIYSTLEKSSAENVLVVLEACRTSLQIDSEEMPDFVRDAGKIPPGMLVFSSCNELEKSWTLPIRRTPSSEPEKLSVFLHFLAEGLTEADFCGGGNNGKLTASELYNYMAQKTTRTVDIYGYQQHPQVIGDVSSFVVGVSSDVNNYLDLKLPIDEQLQVSLNHLVESGNRAIQQVKRKVETSHLESLYWMDKTPRIGNTAKWPNIRGYADASIAEYAQTITFQMHKESLLDISDRCFDFDLQMRPNEPRTLVYRGDMFRVLGMYHEACDDFNKARVNFEMHLPFSTKVRSEIPGPDSEINEADVNTITDIADAIQEMDDRDLRRDGALDGESNGKPAPEIVRCIVLEVSGVGRENQWLRVAVNDLGRPFVGWVRARDAFWSPQLAENYWIANGLLSQRRRNYETILQRTVGNIHGLIRTYNQVAAIVSMAGVGMPDVGGYIMMAEQYIREIVRARIHARMQAIVPMLDHYYLQQWWKYRMEYEMGKHHRVGAMDDMFRDGKAAQEELNNTQQQSRQDQLNQLFLP